VREGSASTVQWASVRKIDRNIRRKEGEIRKVNNLLARSKTSAHPVAKERRDGGGTPSSDDQITHEDHQSSKKGGKDWNS